MLDHFVFVDNGDLFDDVIVEYEGDALSIETFDWLRNNVKINGVELIIGHLFGKTKVVWMN